MRKASRGEAAAAIIFFLVINLFILMAFVIAPADSPAIAAERVYKSINLAIAGLALAFALWRGWYVFLVVFAIAQIPAFVVFANYVNSLPLRPTG